MKYELKMTAGKIVEIFTFESKEERDEFIAHMEEVCAWPPKMEIKDDE